MKRTLNNISFNFFTLILIKSEAEKSRIRSVSASQLLKLAQEFAFKPLITAEYFHIIAKCIIVSILIKAFHQ